MGRVDPRDKAAAPWHPENQGGVTLAPPRTGPSPCPLLAAGVQALGERPRQLVALRGRGRCPRACWVASVSGARCGQPLPLGPFCGCGRGRGGERGLFFLKKNSVYIEEFDYQ